MKIITKQAQGLLLAMFGVCPMGATLAQTKPLPTIAPKVSKTAKISSTTADLLMSSPAAKEHLRQEKLLDDQAFEMVKTGNDLANRGDWQHAQGQYQQALDLSPDSEFSRHLALHGLIACCRAAGDTAKGLSYSRQTIYVHGSAAEGFYENDTANLMQFVLLLNKTKQTAEALQVYNHAAYALNYRDSQDREGKPYLKALLPELVTGEPLPGQVKFTPEALQAFADTALAHEEMAFGSDKEATAHMQEAVKLFPNSAATQYYLGEALLGKNDAGAKAAYRKAAELGDDKIVAATKERLTMIR